jgi:hypothetical protein
MALECPQSEEQITETKKGYLTAHLWHVGAYIPMMFNEGYSAPIEGENGIKRMREALIDVSDGYYFSTGGERNCYFKTAVDTDGLCILTYRGTYRENFATSVSLTEKGRMRLIELLDMAIAQALTPEQIAEQEEAYRQWRIKRDEFFSQQKRFRWPWSK